MFVSNKPHEIEFIRKQTVNPNLVRTGLTANKVIKRQSRELGKLDGRTGSNNRSQVPFVHFKGHCYEPRYPAIGLDRDRAVRSLREQAPNNTRVRSLPPGSLGGVRALGSGVVELSYSV